jgi:HD-like signal output (HDOD) protein
MTTAQAAPLLQTICLTGAAPDGGRAALLEKLLNNPQLVSPPTVALRIVEKTRQPNCSAQELSDLLGQDPALCGKLLKTLNSPLYALSMPVTSLRRAVAILGLKPLRSMVLGLTLPALHGHLKPDEGLRLYWKESVAGAILARELARRLGHPSPEDDLVAALLRDLGMVLLRQSFPEVYAPIWTRASEPLNDLQCDWEERELGVHHAEVSATLLGRWGLPPDIVEPIRHHHRPAGLPAAAGPLLVQRARLLDFISRLARLEESPRNNDLLRVLLADAQAQFRLGRSELEAFLDQARPKIDDFAAILRLDIGACPNFAEVLAAGCEELIRLSAETASATALARQSQAEAALGRTGAATRGGRGQGSTHDEPGNAPSVEAALTLFDRLRAANFKTRIQQFDIEGIIGRGAMGVVLKGLDRGLDRPVALKVLAPELADNEVARQRFALEARFAAAIRHEHVVTVFAVSDLEGIPFLVMELVAGASLQDRLDDGELFSPEEVARIGRQLALGLAAAHDLRLIHRDIKPANVLLEDDSRRVRITDFGLARAMDHNFQLSQNGMLVGTPLFMSPEQVDGLQLTPASDLFSLGSVLYTLCARTPPFASETLSAVLNAVALKDPVPVRELNPQVPPELAAVLSKLMAKKPADRPASAAEVARMLA